MFKTDIDFIGSKEDAKFIGEQFGIKIEKIEVKRDGKIYCLDQAWVSGPKSKVKNFLIDHHYGDENEVEEIYFSN
tara:strand:+ start:237 stop:461 length:225 start_codon:yes stop_codon:yes gene_type:complete